MPHIDEIDPNFQVAKTIGKDDVRFYGCTEKPFRVFGLIPPDKDGHGFLRMPAAAAESVSESVASLNANTTGGRLKFRTDSPYVAIHASLPQIGRMPHFALSGSAGFDLYCKDGESAGQERYVGTFMPPYDMRDGYASVINFARGEEREITIHFPLYSSVQSLEIGLQKDSSAGPCEDYRYPAPVVYYGSSITQGGCASRPGNAYPNMISRMLGCDHVNLGFSGSAKGEDAMADYIASLRMSVFVYDYDHNAPTAEHLRQTHQRMFQRIRERQPDLPVIMVSRPKILLTEEEKERRGIIRRTYQEAADGGDRNVYFIDGGRILLLFGGDSGTVDGSHPNDLGFLCMAKEIGQKVREILRDMK